MHREDLKGWTNIDWTFISLCLLEVPVIEPLIPRYSRWPTYIYDSFLPQTVIHRSLHVSAAGVRKMWQKTHIVALDMKGCICHFVKWQIHPFISKGMTSSSSGSSGKLQFVIDNKLTAMKQHVSSARCYRFGSVTMVTCSCKVILSDLSQVHHAHFEITQLIVF